MTIYSLHTEYFMLGFEWGKEKGILSGEVFAASVAPSLADVATYCCATFAVHAARLRLRGPAFFARAHEVLSKE